MKKWLHVTACTLLLASCSSCRGQDFLRVGVDVENGEPQYTLQSKTVTTARLVEVLKKIGQMSQSQNVVVVPTSRVSAPELLGLLLTIRESGLHKVVISTPAKRNGVEGRITLAMDLYLESFYGDVGPGYSGGFETNSSEFLEAVVKPEAERQK
jgi:hypothetical protein